ncbi:DUF2513 domain-containing protein [Shinella sp. BYT-45]|uniref:DUF2513 domain-containing protein n=1 Tax=Shinella sp. BYT-45 TaxID=3377377 RepID=UPI003980D3B7
MKLDMDLLREVLLHIEENADRVHSDLSDISIQGWTQEQIAYHVVLAAGDDLIKATIDELPDDEDDELVFVSYSVHRLTMRGHDFLASIREPTNWEAIKAGTKKIGSYGVRAAVQFAEAYIKMKIVEHTGVPL